MIYLCLRSELEEGDTRGFTIDNNSCLLVKWQGKLFGYQNRCPHLGIPLEWQPHQFLDDEGELIQCSTHGALFLIDSGECVSGPCAGDSLTPIILREHDEAVYWDLGP